MAEPSSENRLFWEAEASNWLAWARTPGHDAYWDYAPAFFRDIVPDPSGRSLEIGCGEGRVSRDLRAHGHDVYSVDGAPTLIRAAAEADEHRRYVLADATKLPFAEASFDCVVAYNALMDMDDMPTTVLEAGRVLRTGGRMCICVTHPMIDAGRFEAREADARFIIDRDYLAGSTDDWPFERAGLHIRFRRRTWPLEAYSMALESAGLVIDRVREPGQRDEAVSLDPAEARWQRLPNFLFIRADKPN